MHPPTDGLTADAELVPFTAETRMSGVRQDGHAYFKGAVDAIVLASGVNGQRPPDLDEHVERISREGGTPLALMLDTRIVGVVYLKDTVKPGMRQRFDEFRRMGIKTIMITGDNPLTAATIAQEAGVDDFVAQAKPEEKIRIIREQQAEGHLVAMTGDGTNDAPALAQADVGLAMNSGTAAAKEAANMVDLDSNPTKLIEVVAIGKQLLITRGAITTFSVANDVAKYFAIIPAAFVATYPELNALNVMQPGDAGERDPVGGDLQRADHHRAGAAGAARRRLSTGARGRAARPQPADLRRRRHHRCRSSASRSSTSSSPHCGWPEGIVHESRLASRTEPVAAHPHRGPDDHRADGPAGHRLPAGHDRHLARCCFPARPTAA